MNTSLPIFPKREVLTTNITLGTFADHIEGIAAYGAAHRSSYVCCVNAHMTVEARDADLARVVKEADMATADGMPVLFALRWFHKVQQERVAGNDSFLHCWQRQPNKVSRSFSMGAPMMYSAGSWTGRSASYRASGSRERMHHPSRH